MENKDLFKKSLGKHLRLIRIDMDLTLEKFAEETGIDDKHLGRIERGERLPGYETLHKLRAFLNISIDVLIDAVEKEVKCNHTEEK